jgi:hypothetical protein
MPIKLMKLKIYLMKQFDKIFRIFKRIVIIEVFKELNKTNLITIS